MSIENIDYWLTLIIHASLAGICIGTSLSGIILIIYYIGVGIKKLHGFIKKGIMK